MTTPRVFILPSGVLASHFTILTLPHPQSSQPTQYLLHPSSRGLLYEIIKVPNSSAFPRSWLFTKTFASSSMNEKIPKVTADEVTSSVEPDENSKSYARKVTEPKVDDAEGETSRAKESEGQVIQDAHLYMTSPMDPLYLLLPHLAAGKTSKNFVPLDDILETHPQISTWNRILKSSPEAKSFVYERIDSVCETVDAGGETVYWLDEIKVMEMLQKRVETMALHLPGSIKAYIERQLARPISAQTMLAEYLESPTNQSKKMVDVGIIDDTKLAEDVQDVTGERTMHIINEGDSQSNKNGDLQLSTNSEQVFQLTSEFPDDDSMTQSKSTTAIVLPPPDNVLRLSYLSHALQLLTPYLSAGFHDKFGMYLNKQYPPEPLSSYLLELKSLREAAAEAIESSMMYSKRTFEDIEGGVRSKDEVEREKRRKKKDDEAKKSQGVKKLEKVNTRGMAKMTAFFKKKE